MDPSKLKLRPSDASRWTVCTASPRLIEEHAHLIDAEESVYSKEGTIAAQLAAEWLLLGKPKADSFPDIQMMRFVAAYVQFVEGLRDPRNPEEEIGVECRTPLFYNPLKNGFYDSAIYSSRRVVVIDLKYGQGVAVNAFENEQLSIYARSLIESLRKQFAFNDATEIELIIFQPRVRQGDKIKRWKLTLKELFVFTEPIGATYRRIVSGGETVCAPSDSVCTFCPLGDAGLCEARKRWIAKDFDMLTDMAEGPLLFAEDTDEFMLDGVCPEGTVPHQEVLTPEQITSVALNGPRLIKWVESVRDLAFRRLKSGKGADLGLKLVSGRGGTREWNDEALAERALARYLSKEERTKVSVITPAQAYELLADRNITPAFEKKLSGLISRRASSLTMVSRDDPRPEEMPTVQIEFEFDDLDAAEQSLLD